MNWLPPSLHPATCPSVFALVVLVVLLAIACVCLALIVRKLWRERRVANGKRFHITKV